MSRRVTSTPPTSRAGQPEQTGPLDQSVARHQQYVVEAATHPASTARRFPWVVTRGPTTKASPRQSVRPAPSACPPSGRRRCGRARRAWATRASSASAARCRFRCWRASPTRGPSARSRPGGRDGLTTPSRRRQYRQRPSAARECLQVLRTASCSMALATRCLRPRARGPRRRHGGRSCPLRCRRPVKTTSAGSAPMRLATRARATSRCGLGPLTEGVDARRVAEVVGKRLGHALEHCRMPPASWRCGRSRSARLPHDHSIAANPQQ